LATAVAGELVLVTPPEKFSTHDAPVWRDRANFIINAKLPEAGRFEQLWTRQVSADTFELCCIPFFLYDVALGDVVQTEDVDGRQYVLARVVKPSGHFVFRAYFGRSAHPREEVVDRLTELGAVMEWSSATLLAIDALDSEHAQRIADFLHVRAAQEQLMYETGKS
jgi:Domain of unknown function (DUF4265)